MPSDLTKPTFMMAALIGALALFVAGFVIALEVRSTAASPAAATTGSGCYTNWNGNTCTSGYTAVETGMWTAAVMGSGAGPGGATLICASKLSTTASADQPFRSETYEGDAAQTYVKDHPCAICCAVSVGGAVGGIGELPDVAGAGDGLARNHIIIAAVSALVAFGAGAFYARRRWAR